MTARSLLILSLLLLTACIPTAQRPQEKPFHWAAYYGDEEKPEAFHGIDLVVFDRLHHPNLEKLKGESLLLAYISIGEVHDNVPENAILEKENALVASNKHWNSHVVDIANTHWHEIVLAQVEDAAEQGFDGVMLDTVDSPLHWATVDAPEQRGFMRLGAIDLIHKIRQANPDLKIMLNRGFDILPDVKDQLDLILVESILTNPDDSTGHFAFVSPNSYDQAAEQLHRVVALAPHLRILTLDYWDLDDAKGLERIYATQRANNFAPYVTSRDLRHFTPEPGTAHKE